MTLLAYTDGASRGNPGESGIGVIIKDQQGKLIKSQFGYIGKATNNIAEYRALALCLELIRSINCNNLIVHSDSELMVRQLNGQYKVKDVGIKKEFRNIQKMLAELPVQFTIKHIDREQNREADELANRGIDLKNPLIE